MKFTVSNHEDDLFEKRQVRLSIDTDRELAGEILEFAYRRYEERDAEHADRVLKKLFEGTL